jgi:hypothetical protein
MHYLSLSKGDRKALLTQLDEMPSFLETTLGALAAEEAQVPGPDGTFSPVEQCWHLADLEREGYLVRIRRLLAEEDPWLPDFDGARIAQERGYRGLSLARGLATFRDARQETTALLRSVAGAAWERRGHQAAVGAIALCDLPAMIAEHDAAHRREIEAWTRARRTRP